MSDDAETPKPEPDPENLFRAVLCSPVANLVVPAEKGSGLPPSEVLIERGDPRIIGDRQKIVFKPVMVIPDHKIAIYIDARAFLDPAPQPAALTPTGVIAFPTNGKSRP